MCYNQVQKEVAYMLNKKSAMSTMGYAIVLVIILGIVMILSAPMMMGKYKGDKKNIDNNQEQNYDGRQNYDERVNDYQSSSSDGDVAVELRNLESRINSRISDLEARQAQNTSVQNQNVSDKFICSLEGNVDADGNVISIEGKSMDEVKRSKMVFVCEYRY